MIPIFLINLDRAGARLASATAAMTAAGLSAERVTATDGAAIDPASLARFDRNDAVRAIGRPLSAGEIGCFQSHVNCARLIVARGLPHAIVLEDDIRPEPDAAADLGALGSWLATGPDFTLMHLGAASNKFHRPIFDLPSGRRLLRSYYFPIRTHALLWSQAGAQRFLKTYRFDMEIDRSLRNWLSGTGQGLTVKPALFGWTEDDSQIERDRSKLLADGKAEVKSLHRRRRWRIYGRALAGYLRHDMRPPAEGKAIEGQP